MTQEPVMSFEEYAAGQLIDQSHALAHAWVERVASDSHESPRGALPARELVDTMTEVLRDVADRLRPDASQALTASAVMPESLRALARLRQQQGRDPEELLREFDLLAQVLDAACLEWVRSYAAAPAAAIRVAGLLNRAPILMGAITIGAYRQAEAEERLEGSTRLRDFADTLVHELNTPLGAAESAAMVLEDEGMLASTQERRRFVGIIQRSLRRARTMLDDVRDLALARTTEEPAGRWIPLGIVLGEVLVEVRDLIRGAGARIEVAEHIPDLVVDASRVRPILLNLLGNAAKYVDPARPVRWVRVEFERRGAEGGCWIVVSDNGLGIPEEHQGQVYERFYRAHPERAEGTGLGLSIVWNAVKQLGGDIQLQSEPGLGTTFRVFLPSTAGEETG